MLAARTVASALFLEALSCFVGEAGGGFHEEAFTTGKGCNPQITNMQLKTFGEISVSLRLDSHAAPKFRRDLGLRLDSCFSRSVARVFQPRWSSTSFLFR